MASKAYYQLHKEEIKAARNAYHALNKDEINRKRREKYAADPEPHKQEVTLYVLKNPEKVKARRKKHHEKNREKIKQKSREHYLKNKNAIIEQHSGYVKRKYAEDPMFRLRQNTSCRIRNALRRAMMDKGGKCAEQYLGCTTTELKIHLESKFQHGMSWENYGNNGWHVDHIKPCAKFDFSDSVQLHQCFHYTNLQPLWAIDNILKSDHWKEEAA